MGLNMDNRSFNQIKGILQNIDQSLYNLALDINKITRKIIEEDEKAEKDKD
jgi:hypothetical protein